MAAVLPEGKQQYTNAAGLPLVGGKVWTYDAGTNTPRTTWSDAAETAPNANPVILDARGEATIFWRGPYKVVLRDASDNLIWTVDNVVGSDVATAAVTAEIAARFADLANTTGATKGAGMVGYGPAVNYVVGTIGAAVQAQLPNAMVSLSASELADVKAGTYAVNVLSKIQAAIDAVNTLTGGKGGMVVLPPGRWAISGGSIKLYTGIVLEGCNSTVRQLTSNTPIVTVDNAGPVQRWGVQNIVLEFATQQTAAQTSGVGIRVSDTKDSYNWWVRNVQVNYACDGLLAPETTGSYAFTCFIENFTAVAAARWAINFSCDPSLGGNTNVNVTNAWALQFNGSEIAGSRGFRFRACYASRWNALYADHIRGPFCEFTSCEGVWGELTAESCDFLQTSAGTLQIMTFADCVGARRLLKFIANTITASGGGEVYMVRDTTSVGTRRLDIDLYVSEGNIYTGSSAIYEMVPSAGMRIYNKEARLDKSANLADFTPATPRIFTWNGYRRWARGNTASRPTLPAEDVGYLYQDNTLDSDGKPIWWNGTAWVDYSGAVV